MDIETFREYCLSKPFTSESFPFNQSTLVFKVADKMFALTGLNQEEFKINVKCDPERAIELREIHTAIAPGYHMSKKHWNTVNVYELADDTLLKELIDHSYELVFNSLPKKVRETLV